MLMNTTRFIGFVPGALGLQGTLQMALLGTLLVGCAAPAVEDPRTARAEAFVRVESWGEAAGLWNEIYIASGATDIDAGVMSARALLEAEEADGARARLVDLAAKAPSRAEVFSLLGRAHEDLGDPLAARRSFEIAAGLDPKDPVVLRRLGDLVSGAGDSAGGLVLLRQSLALISSDPETRLVFGLRAAEAGLLDEAAPHLDALLGTPRATTQERLRAARPFGADPRVIAWLRPVVLQNPESTEGLRRLGEALFVQGDRKAGLDYLERAARSDPGDVEALLSLGRGLIAAEELNRAAAVIDHVLGLELTPFENSALKDVERVYDKAMDARSEEAVAPTAPTGTDTAVSRTSP